MSDTAPKPTTALAMAPLTGSALLRALYAHREMMAPHQKDRHGGKLMIQAIAEIERLIQLCTNVHDRLLRGDDDTELLQMLERGWKGTNADIRRGAENNQEP